MAREAATPLSEPVFTVAYTLIMIVSGRAIQTWLNCLELIWLAAVDGMLRERCKLTVLEHFEDYSFNRFACPPVRYTYISYEVVVLVLFESESANVFCHVSSLTSLMI